MKILRFCPRCEYYLFLNAADGRVHLNCKNCGFTEPFTPASSEEALILETEFRAGSSATGAASGITVNSYTLLDPTLPHVKTIRCPNSECRSTADASIRDVIYIKTDPQNMRFQYICTVCTKQWTSA